MKIPKFSGTEKVKKVILLRIHVFYLSYSTDGYALEEVSSHLMIAGYVYIQYVYILISTPPQ